MKKIIVLFSVFACLCSCSKDDTDTSAGEPAELNLMSFNLRMITSEDQDLLSWSSRKVAVVKMINDISPDVIGFQEPKWQQVAYLENNLGLYSSVKRNVNEGTEDEDVAAYAMLMYKTDKYRLLEKGSYWLSATPDKRSYPWAATDEQRRMTVWAHLQDISSGKEFLVFSTHLPYKTEDADNEARKECVKLNVSRMKEYGGENLPVFIVGDMNSSYVENDRRRDCLVYYYEWMDSARDTAPVTDDKLSFNSFGLSEPAPTWNIDHIFYRNAEALEFRTVDDDYGVPFISDHYPIICKHRF